MSIRVHEIAKELKLTSKEVVAKLKALKITASSHMSVLTAEDVKSLKASLAGKSAPAPAAKKTEKIEKPADKAEKTVKSDKTEKAPAKKEEVKPAAKQDTSFKSPNSSSSALSSIESAKRELLMKRMTAPPKQASSFEKKPVNTTSYSAPVIRKPMVPPPPPKAKPVQEVRKPFRPMGSDAPIAAAPVQPAEPPKAKKLQIQTPITVKELSEKVYAKPSDLIARLIKLGIFASINQSVNFDVAQKVGIEFGYEIEKAADVAAEKATSRPELKDTSKMVTRAPVVTFMGHVDHGKTSLLDAIRKTKVAASEAGGITQHIGAYEVFLPKGAVTFLDTPGHEAFTQMRARGAQATDVVVLVVAADDGVMPQTIEAIDHAKAANVPIIVAINKMDLPGAQPERVKKGLMEHGLMPEEWGGKTVMVGVSAKTGKGIDELLELLILESDLLELKADPNIPATGVVVEAELSKGSGVLATVLVQEGTLRVGDFAIVGSQYGKVRAMINDRGARIKEALPSMPVEILGLETVPVAGDRFYVVKDEREARQIIEEKQVALRENRMARVSHITLEHLFEDIKAGKVEELKLIVKSDVQGSVEALRNTLGTIKSKNVRLNIIHTGIGDITESDVLLAAASNAVVIGFHVGITGSAREISEKEEVDVRFYQIIYEVKTAIEKAMEGLLMPEEKEVFVGVAEVRQVFKVSKVGAIAGCSVQKGKIVRNFSCRVIRNGQRIHEGKVESLKRFKDDAREVLEGFECGIGVSNFDDLIAMDRIEVFEIQKKARKLE